MNYPTKEQILAKKPKFNKQTIELTKTWKDLALRNWKNDEQWVKECKITMLIETIANCNFFIEPLIIEDTKYFYDPKNKTIHIDIHNLSIISSLHELAHHIFGPSELKACRWSIWLFRECFPEQYKNLKWERHMLKKT